MSDATEDQPSPFAGLTDAPADEQLARLEAQLDAQRGRGGEVEPPWLRDLARELPRVKDARVWFLGWQILLRAPASDDAVRLGQWLLSEPSEPGDLRRDPVFHYLFDKAPELRDKLVERSLRSKDPGVLLAAASKIADALPERASSAVLDAYERALAWNAHDVAEGVETWIEKLASDGLLRELERRAGLAEDEDLREQLEGWATLTRGRLGRRA